MNEKEILSWLDAQRAECAKRNSDFYRAQADAYANAAKHIKSVMKMRHKRNVATLDRKLGDWIEHFS